MILTEDIRDNPRAPAVDPLAIPLARQNLGRRVPGRPAVAPEAVGPAEARGRPEVRQFDVQIAVRVGQEEVFRLCWCLGLSSVLGWGGVRGCAGDGG